MSYEASEVLNIYYRPNESYQFMKNDKKTKTFLDVLFGFMKEGCIYKFSIKNTIAARDTEAHKYLNVCTISLGIHDNKFAWIQDINSALNKAFDGDWLKNAECVCERIIEDEFFDSSRDIYSPLDEKILSEEDSMLMLDDEQAKDPSWADKGYVFNEETGEWHSNPNFDKASALPYVAKELFTKELIENDLNPGKYKFEEEWNPTKAGSK